MTEEVKLEDAERQPCEVWTRVMGYHRPVSEFNRGKKKEYYERKCFCEDKAVAHLDDTPDDAAQMVDICKCNNKECPLRETCFRFLAEDSLYQSYFIGVTCDETEKCDMYWPVKDQEELKQLNRIWKE